MVPCHPPGGPRAPPRCDPPSRAPHLAEPRIAGVQPGVPVSPRPGCCQPRLLPWVQVCREEAKGPSCTLGLQTAPLQSGWEKPIPGSTGAKAGGVPGTPVPGVQRRAPVRALLRVWPLKTASSSSTPATRA